MKTVFHQGRYVNVAADHVGPVTAADVIADRGASHGAPAAAEVVAPEPETNPEPEAEPEPEPAPKAPAKKTTTSK